MDRGGRETYAEWRAQLDDCLMALYPDPDPLGRVSWLSPIHVGVAGWPQASAVPRNFATEPATWYDLLAKVQSQTDWEFYIKVNITSFGSNNFNVFYLSSVYTYPFRVFYIANSQIQVGLLGLSQGITDYNHPGIWEFRVYRSGGVAGAYYRREGITAWHPIIAPQSAVLPPLYWSVAPSTLLPGNVIDAYVSAGGTIVWSYPSFAERVQLVKDFVNIDSSNGVFAGAVPGVSRQIKIALDLRENNTSKTFVCRCRVPSHVGSNALWLSGLITQGYYSLGTVNQQVFNFSTWEDRRSGGQLRLYVTFAGSAAIKGTAFPVESYSIFDRWLTLAAIYDYTDGTVSAYVDGVKIGSSAVVMEAFGLGAGSSLSSDVSVLCDASAGTASGHEIAWAQVYEGVLPDWEIALMSA